MQQIRSVPLTHFALRFGAILYTEKNGASAFSGHRFCLMKGIFMKIKISIFVFLVTVLLSCYFSVNAESQSYIVKLKDTIIPPEMNELLTEVNIRHRIYTIEDISLLEDFEAYIEYTEANEMVSLIEVVPEISLYSMPNDEFYSEQWQLQMINAESAHNIETYGNGINIGIIDSGCNMHEDIAGNIYGGHNFLTGSSDFSDNIGHGTHVAGLIAAESNETGIVGAAPKSNLYIMKCFDMYYETTSTDIVNAIYSAIDDYNCRIINMSLGTPSDVAALSEAVAYAVKKDVIIVAAVGNDGNSTMYYPAGYDGVIGVGSVGISKKRSYFSEVNESVFVVAPGERVKSLWGINEYDYLQGTSQATPLVSGAIAVMLSMKSDMTTEDVKSLLAETSEDLGTSGYDTSYGYGLLNLDEIIVRILEDIPYYISPINNDGIVVLNNKSEILTAVGVFANYSDGVFCGMQKNEIILLKNKKTKIYNLLDGDTIKFFLFDTLRNLKPISKERTIHKLQENTTLKNIE